MICITQGRNGPTKNILYLYEKGHIILMRSLIKKIQLLIIMEQISAMD